MQIKSTTAILIIGAAACVFTLLIALSFNQTWQLPSLTRDPEPIITTDDIRPIDQGVSVSYESAVNASSSKRPPLTLPKFAENSVRYYNAKFGYSLLVPKNILISDAVCVPLVKGFSGEEGIVPLVTLEDGKTTYLTFEYFYVFPGTARRNGYYDIPACEKFEQSLTSLKEETATIRKPFNTWVMVTETIRSDAELDAFIKNRFGSTCSAGARTPTAQDGVFDVAIDGFSSPDEGDCFVNYAVAIKYSPSRQKLVTWDLGQETTFFTQERGQGSYDKEMIDSFRFE